MNLLEETKKFVNKSFEPRQIPHFERTLFWANKLKPGDKALQIAAYAHDIGRKDWTSEYIASLRTVRKLSAPELGELHAIESEKLMREFLSKHTKDKKLIEKVTFLVRHHEEGGSPDADILKDADSLAYFDTNARKHLKKIDIWGWKLVKEKYDWMFNRITSKKAKDIARPIYEGFLKKLEELK